MNRADKIFISIVVACSILFYVPLIWNAYRNKDNVKEVVVSFKDQEILREKIDIDHVYKVKGTLGPVTIEIKDSKVRVEKETSPNHLCSIQGWVSESNRPIVCLPNNIVVEIKSSNSFNDEVDTVIQ